MSSSELPDSVARNVADWTKANADHTDAKAADAWAKTEIDWGVFGVPESELDVLGDVADKDVVELGCGTAYFSAWLARLGARPVGVDLTPAQLADGAADAGRVRTRVPAGRGAAEDVPLPDASFDLAVSEYGASIWCDPVSVDRRRRPRLLRPGGGSSSCATARSSSSARPDEGAADGAARAPQFGLHRIEWPGDEGVEFHLDARRVDPPCCASTDSRSRT